MINTFAGIFGRGLGSKDDLTRIAGWLASGRRGVTGSHSETTLQCHAVWSFPAKSSGVERLAWNESNDVFLLLMGEIAAVDRGRTSHRSQSMHDAGVVAKQVVALYDQLGTGFLKVLNGCFSGLLIDQRRRIAVLFNDRFGVNRVYIHESTAGLVFSSQARVLLHLIPECRSLDMMGVAETFSVGCVLQNRTLFQGVTLLPPGSCWTFNGQGRVARETYFEAAEWGCQPKLEPDEFYQTLKETFVTILPRYVRADERHAMSLTGGIDGRVIVAWSRQRPGDLPCYSFASSMRESEDVRIAREIAKLCGQPHSTIEVGKAFLDLFDTLAPASVRLSDGAMDVSGAVELFVNAQARHIAPVRITGNYGSEIGRGNVAFRPRKWDASYFEPEFAQQIAEAERTYWRERNPQALDFIAFKQVPWHHYARRAVEESQLVVRSPFLDNEFVRLMYRAPTVRFQGAQHWLRLIKDGAPALAKVRTDRGRVHEQRSIASILSGLRKDATARAEYVYDYGMPHWLARADSAMGRLSLEKAFLGRHKFYHFRTWYRHQLSRYVTETLLDSLTLGRTVFRPERLRKLVMAHVSGRGNYTTEIHRALTLEFIQSELLSQPAGTQSPYSSTECHMA